MSTHNMFSIEVAQRRNLISTIGFQKFEDQYISKQNSYKEQALNELSLRLELEEQIRQLNSSIMRLTNQIEELKG